jgi:hypothetical protein
MCLYSSHSGMITWIALYGSLLILKVDSPEAAIAPNPAIGTDTGRPGSGLVSVLLPSDKQTELIRCPIRAAGRHGRRLTIMRA